MSEPNSKSPASKTPAVGERDPQPGDAVVSGLDSEGRYKRAIARNGMLVGAQVVGDARAAAAFAKAFERGTMLPGSLAAIVFGVDTIERRDQTVAAHDERVCNCNEVPRRDIERAVAGGAHHIAEIGRLTLAGTGCGTCRGELAAMVIAAQQNMPR